MLIPKSISTAQVASAAGRFEAIAREVADSEVRARAAAGLPGEDPFQATFDRLNAELKQLEGLLRKAIDRNSVLFWTRFGILVVLAVAVLVATCVLFAEKLYVGGGITGLIDLGLIGWFLAGFRALQDERFNLIFRIAAFRPRLATCTTLSCLEQLAREISESLKFLAAPDAKAPAATPLTTG